MSSVSSAASGKLSPEQIFRRTLVAQNLVSTILERLTEASDSGTLDMSREELPELTVRHGGALLNALRPPSTRSAASLTREVAESWAEGIASALRYVREGRENLQQVASWDTGGRSEDAGTKCVDERLLSYDMAMSADTESTEALSILQDARQMIEAAPLESVDQATADSVLSRASRFKATRVGAENPERLILGRLNGTRDNYTRLVSGNTRLCDLGRYLGIRARTVENLLRLQNNGKLPATALPPDMESLLTGATQGSGSAGPSSTRLLEPNTLAQSTERLKAIRDDGVGYFPNLERRGTSHAHDAVNELLELDRSVKGELKTVEGGIDRYARHVPMQDKVRLLTAQKLAQVYESEIKTTLGSILTEVDEATKTMGSETALEGAIEKLSGYDPSIVRTAQLASIETVKADYYSLKFEISKHDPPDGTTTSAQLKEYNFELATAEALAQTHRDAAEHHFSVLHKAKAAMATKNEAEAASQDKGQGHAIEQEEATERGLQGTQDTTKSTGHFSPELDD